MLTGLIGLTRPRQWPKNLLVLAAPLAAGALTRPTVLVEGLIALACFVLASAATYAFNDALDADADAAHPRKHRRPVASGQIPPRAAFALAAVLATASVAAAVPGRLRWVVVAYLVVTTVYTMFLKDEPVIELAMVASGFILRAIAGGVATGVELSTWFLIVTGFGALLVVTGKRMSEATRVRRDGAVGRPVLAAYPRSYLTLVAGVSMAVTIAAYCLWAFEVGADRAGAVWATASIVPFVLALLRFGLDADRGAVEEPETVLLRDRTLLALGALWLVTYLLGVYW